jgi:hypothetical protein
MDVFLLLFLKAVGGVVRSVYFYLYKSVQVEKVVPKLKENPCYCRVETGKTRKTLTTQFLSQKSSKKALPSQREKVKNQYIEEQILDLLLLRENNWQQHFIHSSFLLSFQKYSGSSSSTGFDLSLWIRSKNHYDLSG